MSIKHCVVLLLTVQVLAAAALAEEFVECNACRDITEFPEDARNHAYNQLRGPDSWMDFDQADRFQMSDRFGNVVTIDMNMEYKIIEIALRSLEFDYARKLIIQVRVIYPNGDIVSYKFDTADIPIDVTLPVGDENSRSGSTSPGGGDGGGGDGGGGSEDDPPDDTSPPGYGPDQPEGRVIIEDPPYDPWEDWCEEC